MKGISLPIEMIVIIAITVLVLTVLAVFFVGGAGEQVGTIGAQQAFGQGCTRLATVYACSKNITLESINITNYGSLLKACQALGHSTEEACRIACRCPA